MRFKSEDLLTMRELDMIRGKMLVEGAVLKEVRHFMRYVSALEWELDRGNEDWRAKIGVK